MYRRTAQIEEGEGSEGCTVKEKERKKTERAREGKK
jgi:hypothetical protein